MEKQTYKNFILNNYNILKPMTTFNEIFKGNQERVELTDLSHLYTYSMVFKN